jgi:hypothetical protein
MSIKISFPNSIVYEQVMSYEKCRNLLRNSATDSSGIKGSIECKMENESDLPIKLKVWLKIKKTETDDKHGTIKEATRTSDSRTLTLDAHSKITERFKMETPRSPGLYSTTLVCEDRKTGVITKKRVPTMKCVLERGKKLCLKRGLHFQVYSHRSGIQNNNKHSLFLSKNFKNPIDEIPLQQKPEIKQDKEEEIKHVPPFLELLPKITHPLPLPLFEPTSTKKTKLLKYENKPTTSNDHFFEESVPESESFSKKPYVDVFFENNDQTNTTTLV